MGVGLWCQLRSSLMAVVAFVLTTGQQAMPGSVCEGMGVAGACFAAVLAGRLAGTWQRPHVVAVGKCSAAALYSKCS